MIRSILILLFVATANTYAERIIPPSNLFRDPRFVKDFVGSYGFLSDVEPKVSADEQTLLVKVRDLFEGSKFKEAEQEVLAFIKETEAPTVKDKEPAEISPALVFVLGNLYFQADRTNEAKRQFLDAIKRYPRFRRAHTNLGYLYISKNQTDEALPMLQKSVELGENSSRVFGLIGYCHLLKKDAVAAEIAYRQAYLLDAASRDWKLGLAQALMAQEKYTEAASLLDTLISENANDKQLWLQQTNAYLASDRKDEAAVNLEVLRHKGLADESNLNLLGNLYMDRAEPQLALNAYLAAMDQAKVFDSGRALKSARILNDYGFPDKAAEFLVKIRAKLGDQPSVADETALLLTEVRVAQSKREAARVGEILTRLLTLDPVNGEVLLEMARHLSLQSADEEDASKRGELVQEARTNFQLAVKNPKVAYEANLGLGQMYVRERRHAEALPPLEAALALKKSESLDQYISRVRRAADRQKQKDEREAGK